MTVIEEDKEDSKELDIEEEKKEQKPPMVTPPVPTSGLKKVITKGDFRKKSKPEVPKKPK